MKHLKVCHATYVRSFVKSNKEKTLCCCRCCSTIRPSKSLFMRITPTAAGAIWACAWFHNIKRRDSTPPKKNPFEGLNRFFFFFYPFFSVVAFKIFLKKKKRTVGIWKSSASIVVWRFYTAAVVGPRRATLLPLPSTVYFFWSTAAAATVNIEKAHAFLLLLFPCVLISHRFAQKAQRASARRFGLNLVTSVIK